MQPLHSHSSCNQPATFLLMFSSAICDCILGGGGL